ncbi:hypothetical protein Rsub_06420 [Raphidocelis subcapitata]|uniref:Uncharacterized protein n=1 Tax=Raphidocelis subcapitata TaxID=307507 RepID=A0A2V0P3A6_9CHLO|nr:hypothetical protein Rsub_06420 [Raphidocelis subcapitata]|eukprot:GBF93382.1 hypothetical protein Rsub_06420 [Raphidocelis subcapitata]
MARAHPAAALALLLLLAAAAAAPRPAAGQAPAALAPGPEEVGLTLQARVRALLNHYLSPKGARGRAAAGAEASFGRRGATTVCAGAHQLAAAPAGDGLARPPGRSLGLPAPTAPRATQPASATAATRGPT